MNWDPIWEHIFRDRESWGRYPPEELVRFVATNFYNAKHRRAVSFLEIGCGPGAGPSWYLAREGFRYCGIDGSETAISRSKIRFDREGLEGEFVHGDLRNLPWADNFFDCVIDIAALQHNDEGAASLILGEVSRVLKPGGRHFSLTASDASWGVGTGSVVDATTRCDVDEGPYIGMGAVRFATRDSLLALYRNFTDVELNYSIRSVERGSREIANWIVTCGR